MLDFLDKLDRKASEFIHHLDFGIGNYIIFAFASLFNRAPGITTTMLYIYFNTGHIIMVAKLGAFYLIGLITVMSLKK